MFVSPVGSSAFTAEPEEELHVSLSGCKTFWFVINSSDQMKMKTAAESEVFNCYMFAPFDSVPSLPSATYVELWDCAAKLAHDRKRQLNSLTHTLKLDCRCACFQVISNSLSPFELSHSRIHPNDNTRERVQRLLGNSATFALVPC